MAWYDSNWGKRLSITVDPRVSETYADYIAEIDIQGNDNAVTTSPHYADYTLIQSLAEDIRFTDSDGTTLISHALIQWDDIAKTGKFYVKIPSISTGGSFIIYLYYDNSSAADASDLSAVAGKRVPSYTLLRFDAGTAIISEGDTITGTTSTHTATAKSDAVVITGSYATSDAVGYLILDAATGIFQDNENLQVSSITKMVAEGTLETPEHALWNFDGTGTTEQDQSVRNHDLTLSNSLARITGTGPRIPDFDAAGLKTYGLVPGDGTDSNGDYYGYSGILLDSPPSAIKIEFNFKVPFDYSTSSTTALRIFHKVNVVSPLESHNATMIPLTGKMSVNLSVNGINYNIETTRASWKSGVLYQCRIEVDTSGHRVYIDQNLEAENTGATAYMGSGTERQFALLARGATSSTYDQISQVELLSFKVTNLGTSTVLNDYDFSTGSGTTLTDLVGSDDITLTNTLIWGALDYADPSVHSLTNQSMIDLANTYYGSSPTLLDNPPEVFEFRTWLKRTADISGNEYLFSKINKDIKPLYPNKLYYAQQNGTLLDTFPAHCGFTFSFKPDAIFNSSSVNDYTLIHKRNTANDYFRAWLDSTTGKIKSEIGAATGEYYLDFGGDKYAYNATLLDTVPTYGSIQLNLLRNSLFSSASSTDETILHKVNAGLEPYPLVPDAVEVANGAGDYYGYSNTLLDSPPSTIRIEFDMMMGLGYSISNTANYWVFHKVNDVNTGVQDIFNCRLLASTGSLRPTLFVNGTVTTLDSTTVSWAAGQWYRIKIEVDANGFRLYVDQNLEAENTGTTAFMGSGTERQFALLARGATSSTYDQFSQIRLGSLTFTDLSDDSVIASYDMSAGTGTTLADSTTNFDITLSSTNIWASATEFVYETDWLHIYYDADDGKITVDKWGGGVLKQLKTINASWASGSWARIRSTWGDKGFQLHAIDDFYADNADFIMQDMLDDTTVFSGGTKTDITFGAKRDRDGTIIQYADIGVRQIWLNQMPYHIPSKLAEYDLSEGTGTAAADTTTNYGLTLSTGTGIWTALNVVLTTTTSISSWVNSEYHIVKITLGTYGFAALVGTEGGLASAQKNRTNVPSAGTLDYFTYGAKDDGTEVLDGELGPLTITNYTGMTVAANYPHEAVDNRIAHYPIDEGMGTVIADSEGSYNMTATNSLIWGATAANCEGVNCYFNSSGLNLDVYHRFRLESLVTQLSTFITETFYFLRIHIGPSSNKIWVDNDLVTNGMYDFNGHTMFNAGTDKDFSLGSSSATSKVNGLNAILYEACVSARYGTPFRESKHYNLRKSVNDALYMHSISSKYSESAWANSGTAHLGGEGHYWYDSTQGKYVCVSSENPRDHDPTNRCISWQTSADGLYYSAPSSAGVYQFNRPGVLGDETGAIIKEPVTKSVASITFSGTTAMVTIDTASWPKHGYPVNYAITIGGATGGDASLYNISTTITADSSDTVFTYTMSGTPTANAVGTLTVTANEYWIYCVSQETDTDNDWSYHLFTCAELSEHWSHHGSVFDRGRIDTTLKITQIQASTPSAGTATATIDTAVDAVATTSIERVNATTAKATIIGGHKIPNGASIKISGATPSAFNVTSVTATVTDYDTITYTVASDPVTNATVQGLLESSAFVSGEDFTIYGSTYFDTADGAVLPIVTATPAYNKVEFGFTGGTTESTTMAETSTSISVDAATDIMSGTTITPAANDLLFVSGFDNDMSNGWKRVASSNSSAITLNSNNPNYYGVIINEPAGDSITLKHYITGSKSTSGHAHLGNISVFKDSTDNKFYMESEGQVGTLNWCDYFSWSLDGKNFIKHPMKHMRGGPTQGATFGSAVMYKADGIYYFFGHEDRSVSSTDAGGYGGADVSYYESTAMNTVEWTYDRTRQPFAPRQSFFNASHVADPFLFEKDGHTYMLANSNTYEGWATRTVWIAPNRAIADIFVPEPTSTGASQEEFILTQDNAMFRGIYRGMFSKGRLRRVI